jgi:membrane protease YdiL (CAAX protease family)
MASAAAKKSQPEGNAVSAPGPVGRFTCSLSLAGLFSGENKKPTIILLLSPFVLVTLKYFGTRSFYLSQFSSSFVFFGEPQLTAELYEFLCSFFLLGIVPFFVITFLFKEPISSYGLQLGDWRFGLKAFLVLAPIMVAATFPSSKQPEFLAQYPLFKGAGASPQMFVAHAASYLIFYIGWETYFRGFMQFGLRGALGDWNAILVQTLVSCIVHIGKPGGEIYGSIIAGLAWGIVAFRARSIFVVILLHWLLGVSLDFFICFVR